MSERSGQIQVKTKDIFPIIKKWLYSEHDIFIRELISNATDAITKRGSIARTKNETTPDGMIKIIVDKKNKTIKVIDNGLGMSEAEVEKYLASIAFSGAEEFVLKMKEMGTDAKNEIIGKFGLGFYSAFMVASKVEVDTLSMNGGEKPAHWECEGDVDYKFSSSTRTDVGTEITLHVTGEEEKEFLDTWKLRSTITRYCDFMPYPIYVIDAEKIEELGEAINETKPLWKKDPTTISDDEYKEFFKKMFPADPDPLFWVHLKVDHPFTLEGLLYFPKFDREKPVVENSIRLYAKQVFVSDNVKNIVPDFLSLLKGAIDSPDIPLNVSRSSLQGDPNVKKIANYVVKKIAEAVKKLSNGDRTRLETIWEDIGIFVKYGCVSDEKFDEIIRSHVLFKATNNKHLTLDEYRLAIPAKYADKLKGKVLYFNKGSTDPHLKKQIEAEGLTAMLCDDYIDSHFMQHAEFKKQGEHEYKFVSVDSEIENLMETENLTESDMQLKDLFETEFKESHKELTVEVKRIKGGQSAAFFKIDEMMKRMKSMSKMMGGAAFPIKKTLVINPQNALIESALLFSKSGKTDLASRVIRHVHDLAEVSSEGLKIEARDHFVAENQRLLEDLAKLAAR